MERKLLVKCNSGDVLQVNQLFLPFHKVFVHAVACAHKGKVERNSPVWSLLPHARVLDIKPCATWHLLYIACE
jgi:hypothetical protein